MVEDPRDAGRYTLPRTALAAAKEAGILRTVPLGAAASVGKGGEDGGHLTSDGVLARQQPNVAADIEGLDHTGEQMTLIAVGMISWRRCLPLLFLFVFLWFTRYRT